MTLAYIDELNTLRNSIDRYLATGQEEALEEAERLMASFLIIASPLAAVHVHHFVIAHPGVFIADGNDLEGFCGRWNALESKFAGVEE